MMKGKFIKTLLAIAVVGSQTEFASAPQTLLDGKTIWAEKNLAQN
ncbi:hypothetical protein RGQ13_07045 [Thalassotalea psychrophila]|uniref:Uncharacterized protein n=1 Tax=Thalassotalea psychrophila TaxID=3065647 RepID=A0ABY9TYN9_9GAMM|nr:hypothetical protein RGQ13_07045 [Colwelliaceae bacterium SQ149]